MTQTAQLELVDRRGQLMDPGPIRHYILGGNSCFTLLSTVTGKRFTYKVKSAAKDRDKNWSTGNQDRTTFFVSVLYGPDNDSDYAYIGMLKQNHDGYYEFRQTLKSRFKQGSPQWDAFDYCWQALDSGCHWPSKVEFWHEGQCCICGRKLTVPESVERGIGPECASK